MAKPFHLSCLTLLLKYTVWNCIFTALKIYTAVFWILTPYSQAGGYQHFRSAASIFRIEVSQEQLLSSLTLFLSYWFHKDGGSMFLWNVGTHQNTWNHDPEDHNIKVCTIFIELTTKPSPICMILGENKHTSSPATSESEYGPMFYVSKYCW
jgi:hypothetical protein